MTLTLQELVTEVWEGLGEPTNLAPFGPDPQTGELSVLDLALPGAVKIIRALNQAQTAVAYWKDPQSNRQFRWRDAVEGRQVQGWEGEILAWQDPLVEGLIFTTSLPAGLADLTGYHVYDGTTAVEVRGQTLGPDGYWWLAVSEKPVLGESQALAASLAVRRNWLELPADVDFIDVLRVNRADGTELIRAPRADNYLTGARTWDSGSSWQRRNHRIYLDGLLGAEWFTVTAHVAPPALALADDISVLPGTHHQALVLWALGWGYGLSQEMEMRLAWRSEFKAFMRETQTFDDFGNNTENRFMRPGS